MILRSFIESPKSGLNKLELKLAKIIFLNYDKIEPTSYYRGIRQKEIARLIRLNHNKTLDLPLKTSNDYTSKEIQNLTRLTVMSFRGFQAKQTFRFGKRFTFVYGPNGTGKSSLVEAIEYSLMGNIQEAKYKRIDINQYIKNIYTKNAVLPKLYGMSNDGKEVEISPDTEKYNFSVIERNRIDNFSRMSAETNSVQQQRLAALVGLDSWNTFVNAFSREIDTYLSYENELTDEIKAAQKDLDDSKSSLATSERTVTASSSVLTKLLNEFQMDDSEQLSESFAAKKAKLSTELSKNGTLALISPDLLASVNTIQAQFLKTQKIYHENTSKINDYKDDLSLVDLAKAILSQKFTQSNVCPACHTSIKNKDGSLNVAVDPYENAQKIQAQFRDATNIETSNNKLRSQLKNELRALDGSLQKLLNQFENSGLHPMNKLTALSKAIDAFFGKTIAIPESVWLRPSEIDEINGIIKKHNCELGKSTSQKVALQNDLNRINQNQGSLNTAKESVEASLPIQENLRKNIEASNQLIVNLSKKAQIAIDKNKSIKELSRAYETLIIKLRNYTESLPNKELVDLDQLTLEIYNLINKYDYKGEQVTELKLPLLPTQVIQIKFNVPDSPLVNALDVLSEGHIRVLGLSILLAKALKQKLPFIIFDDVVNAIDDDHRKAIAQIITDSEGIFSGVQWIVTTHGQEFAKQLISNTPNSLRKNIKEITFKEKNLGADIHYIDKTQNYLLLAQQKLEDDDIRGCLADCRREAEVLMIKLWKIYNKRFNRRISLEVDPSNPIPETRNVFDVLRSSFKNQLRGNDAELTVLETVLSKLDTLLDNQGISWFLLNKGTHEEENAEQHDRVDTEQILNQLLVPLDEELTTKIKVKGAVLVRKTV